MSCVLLVHTVGGPQLELTLPKVAAHAVVHVLAVTEPPARGRGLWRPLCASVTTVEPSGTDADLVDVIRRRAVAVRADAVLTLSESAVVAVARACHELGLAGPGSNVVARAVGRQGHGEPHLVGTDGDALLDQVVPGDAEGWFTESGWSDHVTVEGIVAGGVHHPLCITGRLASERSFTARSSVTPIPLSEEAVPRIESAVRAAVEAVRLDTCATHTEVRLGTSGQLRVTGTAARFGSAAIIRQAEEVHALDVIGMLVRQLLGKPVAYPSRLLTKGQGAAASLVVLPVHSAGQPRPREAPWDLDAVDWMSSISPGGTVEVALEPSLDDGTAVRLYVSGADARTVAEACLSIVDSLPTPPLLDLGRFAELSGSLAGQRYVKVVVDRERDRCHFLDHTEHAFHAHYIADRILGVDRAKLLATIDAFNHSLYRDPDRRFLLGALSLQHHEPPGPGAEPERCLVLETVEADTMGAALLMEFHSTVRARLDPSLPLLLKPANHLQEAAIEAVPEAELPRVLAHASHDATSFTVLNTGDTQGRLRHFADLDAYRAAEAHGGIEWYDILAMPVVPDDIPQVAGLIFTRPTTPLSHTNILATGWGIPNAVIHDLPARLVTAHGDLSGSWVHYAVTSDQIVLERATEPAHLTRVARRPAPVVLGTPRTEPLPIRPLSRLRADDRHAYGGKAANLGELHHVLRHGSPAVIDFYSAPRPPHPHLLPQLAEQLGAPLDSTPEGLIGYAGVFLRDTLSVPEGIGLPFCVQQEFLTASPALQQRIGLLKQALTLGPGDEIDALCAEIQDLVRNTAFPDRILRDLVTQLVRHVPGTTALVVRSSSNAEDLPGFSAAGLYESVTQVTDLPHLAAAVRQVWASLFSARGVRLRHAAGIALDDSYMGVVVQRRRPAAYGGVMVTCNPARRDDFRNVLVNCTVGSVQAVVEGTVLPLQYLFDTVEGGGRTLSLGDATEGLDSTGRERLSRLALAGRLLQGHFRGLSDHATSLDVEWLLEEDGHLCVVQARPYTSPR
ncbi:PEP/pyruvate-binding domain-containing protein [Streptomyces sp. NPDC056632]|uniref:PEP/pyruvate-binding domain-containing protein n=1 Tax=Streptomyces sp. NPDC056632 TaxID=3345884 RepID=UPI003694C159